MRRQLHAGMLTAYLALTEMASADINSSSGVRLEIDVAAAASVPPVLRVVLTNHSSRAIWVNKRFLLNEPGVPPGFSEINVLARDDLGVEKTFGCRAKAARATRDDYVLLPAGGIAGRLIPLTCVDFAPRPYKVVVRYHDRLDDINLFPKAARLDQEITSNTVDLNLTTTK